MTHRFSISAVTLSLALLAPTATLAAPTQQQLDDALAHLTTQRPLAIQGTINVTETERSYTRKYAPQNSSGKMSFSARFLAENNNHTDSEGRISLDSATLSSSTGTLTNAGSFDWRAIAGTTYLFVGLPAQTLEPLASTGFDLSPVLNTWVRIDGSTSTSAEEPSPLGSLSALPVVSSIAEAKSAGTDANGDMSLRGRLRVLRVESTSTDANGHKISRVRLTPHYANIWKEQQAKRADAIKNLRGAERRQALTDINTQYNDLRSALQPVHIVAVIDETTSSIQRIEIGGTQRKPTQQCDFAANSFAYVCKNVALKTTTYAIGLNVLPAATTAIVAPATSTSLEQILNSAFTP